MNRTRVVSGLVAAFLVAACGSSGGGGGGNSYSGKTLKLGAVLSITGAGGVYGPQSRDGANLAVKQINAAGGVNGVTAFAGFLAAAEVVFCAPCLG